MLFRRDLTSESHMKISFFPSGHFARYLSRLNSVSVVFFRFVNYGSGPKRFPLQDVLQYALEFAQSRPKSSQTAQNELNPPPPASPNDIEMESPKSASRLVQRLLVRNPCSRDDNDLVAKSDVRSCGNKRQTFKENASAGKAWSLHSVVVKTLSHELVTKYNFH